MIGPIYAAPIVHCQEKDNVPFVKPIRLVQFILIAILFILTSCMISKESPYNRNEAVAILALFGAFLLITLVDIVSQCGNDPIPDTPMFLLGVLGTILFSVAAAGIFAISRRDDVKSTWRLIFAMILSIICSILFLLDVLLIFLYGY